MSRTGFFPTAFSESLRLVEEGSAPKKLSPESCLGERKVIQNGGPPL